MKKGHISNRPPKQKGYAAEAPNEDKRGRAYYSTASRSKQ